MTESDRSVAQEPSVTVNTSPSEHRSFNGLFKLASVCFRNDGGLGMYKTRPGRVRDGAFSPLVEASGNGKDDGDGDTHGQGQSKIFK